MMKGPVVVLLLVLVATFSPAASADEVDMRVFATDGGDRYWFNVDPPGGTNPTLTLGSGDQVTVSVSNAGSQPHNIHFGSPIARGSQYLMPGSSQNFTFTVPGGTGPMEIQYWCDPHRQLGMVGTVLLAGARENTTDARDETGLVPSPTGALLLGVIVLGAAVLRRRSSGGAV